MDGMGIFIFDISPVDMFGCAVPCAKPKIFTSISLHKYQ